MVSVFHFGTSMANDHVHEYRKGPITIIDQHTLAQGHAPYIDQDVHNDNHAPPAVEPIQQDENVAQPATQPVAPPLEDYAVYDEGTGYELGAGDVLKITVYNESALSGTYKVNDKGVVSMPLIGDIDVRDKSVANVTQNIKTKLEAGFIKNPDVVIEISEFRPFYIMGEVKNPGSYSFVTDMTILNAVVLAGGYTYRANEDEHEVMREHHGNSMVLGSEPDTAKVQPGDIILVKERFF